MVNGPRSRRTKKKKKEGEGEGRQVLSFHLCILVECACASTEYVCVPRRQNRSGEGGRGMHAGTQGRREEESKQARKEK